MMQTNGMFGSPNQETTNTSASPQLGKFTSTLTMKGAQTLQTYDLEWQVVRAFWGSHLCQKIWGKPWINPQGGKAMLRLYKEYVDRVLTPIMEKYTVLSAIEHQHNVGFKHTSPPPDAVLQTSWDSYQQQTNPQHTTRMTDGQYQTIKEGRSQILLSEQPPTTLIELGRRCWRVKNALTGAKMSMKATGKEELLPLINDVITWLQERLDYCHQVGLADQMFPQSAEYAERFIQEQKELVWVVLIGNDRQPLDWVEDQLTLTPRVAPYYLGTIKHEHGRAALALVRADLKHRESVARNRSHNYDNPNIRLALKRSIYDVLEEVGPTRMSTSTQVPHHAPDIAMGGADLDTKLNDL